MDWKDNRWQSPNDPKANEKITSGIVQMAEEALQAFGELLDKVEIPKDPRLV